MVNLTPTERLSQLAKHASSPTKSKIEALLHHYERFLQNTHTDENELILKFLDKTSAGRLMEEAYEFGDRVWEVLETFRNDNYSKKDSRFFRLMMV